jgi:hypothetical protein
VPRSSSFDEPAQTIQKLDEETGFVFLFIFGGSFSEHCLDGLVLYRRCS